MELAGDKNINDIKHVNACFSNELSYGTIFYGTLFNHLGNRFFTIEDIFSYKGELIERRDWIYKMEKIKKILKYDLKQASYNNSFVIFGLPIMCRTTDELENKLKKDKYKEEFKKLSKEEKKKVIDKQKENNKKNVIQKYIEFPYLEDLNDIQYEELKNNNWIVADPGKRHLLYMKSKDGKVLKYSNRKHLSKTKRLKYQRLLENYKTNMKLIIIKG
jgi:hypothetical protein